MGFLSVIGVPVLLPVFLPVALWNAWFVPLVDPASIMQMGIEDLLFFELKMIGAVTISGILLLAFSGIAQGAVAYGIAHRYLGNGLSAGTCIRFALRRWLRLLGATFVYGLAVAFGTMFCIVPGVFIMLVWYVLFPVLVFEDVPIGRALGRSNALMNGHKGKVFVLAVVLGIVTNGLSIAATLMPNVYLGAVVNSVLGSFFVGINTVAATVVYFSTRCRNEQFDLEMLAMMVEGKQQVDQPAL